MSNKMNYSKEFTDLVNYANEESVKFYSDPENENKPNPFYIGYGNPNIHINQNDTNEKILIIGKEKGFNPNENFNQLKAESIDNPKQWKYLIDNNIQDIYFEFSEEKYFKEWPFFCNPIQPYKALLKGKGQGQTWYYYNKLVCLINDENFDKVPSQLFSKVFITELNTNPSKTSPGKNNLEKPICTRIDFFRNNKFFQKFKIVILAFGNYLEEKQILEVFGENLTIEEFKIGQKLVIYTDFVNKRIIINTRQLSNQFPKTYLENIAKIIKEKFPKE